MSQQPDADPTFTEGTYPLPGEKGRPPARTAFPLRRGAEELLGFALAMSRGPGVGAADVVLAALLRRERTSLNRRELDTAATTVMYRTVPARAEQRIRAALSAAGVEPVTGAVRVTPDDPRLQSVLGRAQALARRLGVTAVYSHHLVGAAMTAEPLPAAVLAALGVTAEQLRAALRTGVAGRWPREPGAVWDELLGPLPDIEVAAETAELLGWAAAVRGARGPGAVDDLDVVLGAVAAAASGSVPAGSPAVLYAALPTDGGPPRGRVDAALAAVGVSSSLDWAGPWEVAPIPTVDRASAIARQVSGSPAVGRRREAHRA